LYLCISTITPLYIMEQNVLKVLSVVKEEGLCRGMMYYSSLICSAPKLRLPTNMGNTHTPVGQVTKVNPNYRKELTAWKNEKLFPFFMEHGFGKKELNESWRGSIYKR